MDPDKGIARERDEALVQLLTLIRRQLTAYVFRCRYESDLQEQVATALTVQSSIKLRREVIDENGRYDLLLEADHHTGPLRVVIELKLRASASAVERQAQKYALTAGVDAVVLATTSARLANQLSQQPLGGKPFRVIVLRSF